MKKGFKWSIFLVLLLAANLGYTHGTVVSPASRVYRIFQSNPENPNFLLAQNAILLDSKNAYYNWNTVARNIPEAVQAGLPAGFDYSPWIPNGQIASGGRIDSNIYGDLTYNGLDQANSDWPTMEVQAGDTIQVDFLATTVHEPSVWDFWITTSDWDPGSDLNWEQMEFIGRENPVLQGNHYYFDLEIPSDRSGHHVLWVVSQRDDPAGEVYFSASDLTIFAAPCEDTLVLETINQPLYYASQNIFCSAQIFNPTDLSLIAGGAIELLPTFQVGLGATLDIYIENCPDPQNAMQTVDRKEGIIPSDQNNILTIKDNFYKMALALQWRKSLW